MKLNGYFDSYETYEKLSKIYDMSRLFKHGIEFLTFSGLSIMNPILTGMITVAKFQEFVDKTQNKQAFVDSFGILAEQIINDETLQKKYPAIYQVLTTVEGYLEEPDLQTVIEEAFKLIFSPFASKSGIYTNQSLMKAYNEFADALYRGIATMTLSVSTAPSIQSLYEALYARPDFDTIEENSTAYIDLAFILYALSHYNAYLAVGYISDIYLNQHKDELYFNDSIGLQVVPMFAYPAKNETTTMYYDNVSHTVSPTRPQHEDFRELTGIPVYDPSAPRIQYCEILAGWGIDAGTMYGRYQDVNGNTVPVATFNGSPLGQTSAFNVPVLLNQQQVRETVFTADYYRNGNTQNKYWHDYDVTGFRCYNGYVKLSAMGLEESVIQKLVNDQAFLRRIYNRYTPSQDRRFDLEQNEGYAEAYEYEDGVELTDSANQMELTVMFPTDEDFVTVLDGSKTISDLMAKQGTYAVSVANPNHPIRVPDSTVDFQMSKRKSEVIPLAGVNVPNGLFHVYLLSTKNATDLGSELYNPEVQGSLKKIFADPAQSIISLGYIPFTIPNQTEKQIRIGDYTTSVTARILQEQYAHFYYGLVEFDEFDYLSMEPYAEYEIYIPYSGMHPIPASLLSGNRIKIRSILDIVTGDMVTELYVICPKLTEMWYYTEGMEDIPAMTFTGNCLRKLPISSASGDAMMNTIAKVGGGVATIGSAFVPNANFTGDLVSAVGSTVSSFTPATIAPAVSIIGEITGNVGFMGATSPYIVGRRKGIFNSSASDPVVTYNNIGHEVSIWRCEGYAEMINPQIDYYVPDVPVPLREEIEMVTAALAAGVELPSKKHEKD